MIQVVRCIAQFDSCLLRKEMLLGLSIETGASTLQLADLSLSLPLICTRSLFVMIVQTHSKWNRWVQTRTWVIPWSFKTSRIPASVFIHPLRQYCNHFLCFTSGCAIIQRVEQLNVVVEAAEIKLSIPVERTSDTALPPYWVDLPSRGMSIRDPKTEAH